MNRRNFLKSAAATATALASPPAWAAVSKTPSLTEPDLLAQAAERIEQHRKGPGVVVVRSAEGKPVAGAKLKVEQLRHDFLFGCNFFRFGHISNPELQDQYNRRFAALFNYATLGFYWPMYEPRRGQPIYEYTDRVLAWTGQHGITCKGHPLVWDFADPSWLPKDFAEIRTLSNGRVREIVSRFKGQLDLWDVVNEPTHLGRFGTRLGEWAIAVGAAPYVREHLEIARAANPAATLLVNDYRTDPPFLRILEQLRQDGKPLFDAVGIQSHMHGGGWPLRQVWEVCDQFAGLGRPLHFTETTVVSGPKSERQPPASTSNRRPFRDPQWDPTTPALEASQADYVPKFYTALFAHPSVQAVTWWDFSDNGAWQGAPAGWVRQDMSPKPVYERMMDLVKKQWWTRAQGEANGQGEFALRAFYGTYRVSAELPDGKVLSKDVHWQRGQPNRFEVSTPKATS